MTATIEFIPIGEIPQKSSEVGSEGACIALLKINRPDSANAFNADVMQKLTTHLKSLENSPNVRVLLLTSVGKHFSAGADLNWMKDSAKLSMDENIADSGKLQELFEALCNLDIPTIAYAKGATYGGAVGLLSCCDIVLASENARFCLSEVKLGLLPAVIVPYLARKMGTGALKRFGVSSKVFSASEALQSGLVNRIIEKENAKELVEEEINFCLDGGPEAIKSLKQLIRTIESDFSAQNIRYQKAISKARTGKEGQHGLQAFFNKTTPEWKQHLRKGALGELI